MTEIETLSTPQCWELLRKGSVGRIGFSSWRGERIHPIHYWIEDDAILMETARDSDLGDFAYGRASGAVVPFEVDEVTPTAERWSVLVRGHLSAAAIDDAQGPHPRATAAATTPPEGHREVQLRLTPTQVTGRRLTTVDGHR